MAYLLLFTIVFTNYLAQQTALNFQLIMATTTEVDRRNK